MKSYLCLSHLSTRKIISRKGNGRRGREIWNISGAPNGGREKSRNRKKRGCRRKRRNLGKASKQAGRRGRRTKEARKKERKKTREIEGQRAIDRSVEGVVRCSRGRKWRGVLMRFRYRPGHLVSRLQLLFPRLLPRYPVVPWNEWNSPHRAARWTRESGSVRGWRKGGGPWKRTGLPRKGGVAARMGRYVCRGRTAATPPPSWNRCRSSGRKELLRSSGAPGVHPTHPLSTCVRVSTHIFHLLVGVLRARPPPSSRHPRSYHPIAT